MKPTRNALMLITTALCLSGAGCTVTTHKHAARPVSATLVIEIEGQPKQVQRMIYNYKTPMEHYQTLPVAELERILRERESAGVVDTELRVLIEKRKAGLK